MCNTNAHPELMHLAKSNCIGWCEFCVYFAWGGMRKFCSDFAYPPCKIYATFAWGVCKIFAKKIVKIADIRFSIGDMEKCPK